MAAVLQGAAHREEGSGRQAEKTLMVEGRQAEDHQVVAIPHQVKQHPAGALDHPAGSRLKGEVQEDTRLRLQSLAFNYFSIN